MRLPQRSGIEARSEIQALPATALDVETGVVLYVGGSVRGSDADAAAAGAKIKTRRDFEVSDLNISNVYLVLHRPERDPISLEVRQVTSAPLRSRFAGQSSSAAAS